ncbi:VanW family protein [Corynebacterium alimapuense]|uniref:YoaR-like putative peptidoglycan binding domain-containing protein n=1 Tax=Corynebacterium alimapuense TaxID=1576874 RepID=A0A3M8KBS0_9CORY|nr:VanW family protein [Corynebacterium alimapuense]RNE49972.1 hypothetical protein C5L39_00935 [Corynebacterium alimapuense]
MRIFLGVAVGLLAVMGIAYGVDYALTKGNVPRGTTVGGVAVGGLSPDEARDLLEKELGGVVDEPVSVSAGERTSQFIPLQAGMAINWDETVSQLGTESLNPLIRLQGLFGVETEAEIVSDTNEALLNPEVDRIHEELNAEPVDGAVLLIDGRVDAIAPVIGQTTDAEELHEAITTDWLNPEGVTVEADLTDPMIGQDAVDEAAEGPAAAALSAPIEVRGRDEITGVINLEQMGQVVSFVPDGELLRTDINTEAAEELLSSQLSVTESERLNATITYVNGAKQITPSVDGVEIDWETTMAGFADRVLNADVAAKNWEAVYLDDPAAFTTEMAETATFDEVLGEFTTSGYAEASGINIAQVSNTVNGAIVAPGETFSLNEFTGSRGTAQGYVESGVIIDGRAGEAVGGGISQFATTLYNATYFSGMDDIAHTPHSYYISRYPAGREATVYEGAIDLQFRNSSPYPVRIESFMGGGDLTVQITGIKTVQVESVNGGKWAFTEPPERDISGEDCIPSSGNQGFTTSDTRIISNLSGNEISRETQTTVYDPQPIVTCTG